MPYETILTTLENGIFTIVINRPDKMNALNQTVMQELDAAMDEVYANNHIKAVIITGAGSKSFVAGADIAEFPQLSPQEGAALAAKGHQIFNKIERAPKPVIAAVNGFALGGGCELAMSCHLRTAAENARFGQPEVNLGLIPGYGGTQRLVQLIGKGRAMELLMTADMIDAHQAHQWGLVNHVFPADALMPKTIALIQHILTKGPQALARIISAVNAYYQPQTDGFAAEIQLFGECFGTNEMKEGVTAFLEKRKPAF